MIASGRASTLGEVLSRVPQATVLPTVLAVAWMAKLGVLDWLEA